MVRILDESNLQEREERKEEEKVEPTPYELAGIDPNDLASPLWDEEKKLWLDRKTKEPLRDQDPGVPQNKWIGNHDNNDMDDVADGILPK